MPTRQDVGKSRRRQSRIETKQVVDKTLRGNSMNYNRLVQVILDIGEEMLKSGAENFRLDDSLYRLCDSYGFVRSDVFVIPSNIQMTVETPEGEIITQVRHIESVSSNYDRLDYLNNLCRKACDETPDEVELKRRLQEVLDRPKQHPALRYIGSVMGGAGFGVFFGCDAKDAFVAAIVSLAIAGVGGWLSKKETNLLVHNSILAFMAEVIIIGFARAGICNHPSRVMIGIVMLLVSAMGVTTGMRELIQRDFISGTINIMNSLLGAAGIVFGIATAVLGLNSVASENYILTGNVWVQLISCTIACVGFALLFKIKGRQVIYSGIGAFLTWGIYVLVFDINDSNFWATLVGACFVAAFALVMARVNKAPATIFLTATVFPLIPGANLYYMMYGFLLQNGEMITEQTNMLLETCVAIALGFLVVDVVMHMVTSMVRKVV